MKINSNTFGIDPNSLEFHKIEYLVKKIASDNGITDVDSIHISMTADEGSIKFKLALDGPAPMNTNTGGGTLGVGDAKKPAAESMTGEPSTPAETETDDTAEEKPSMEEKTPGEKTPEGMTEEELKKTFDPKNVESMSEEEKKSLMGGGVPEEQRQEVQQNANQLVDEMTSRLEALDKQYAEQKQRGAAPAAQPSAPQEAAAAGTQGGGAQPAPAGNM